MNQWDPEHNLMTSILFHILCLMLYSILTCVVSPSVCSSSSSPVLGCSLAEGCLVLVVGGVPLSSSHVGLQSAASNNQESACNSEVLQSSHRSTDWVLYACCALPLKSLNTWLVCQHVFNVTCVQSDELLSLIFLYLAREAHQIFVVYNAWEFQNLTKSIEPQNC